MATNIHLTINGPVNVNVQLRENLEETIGKREKDDTNPGNDDAEEKSRFERQKTSFTTENIFLESFIKEMCQSQKGNIVKFSDGLKEFLKESNTEYFSKIINRQTAGVYVAWIGPNTTIEEIEISNSSAPGSPHNLATNLPSPNLAENTRPNSPLFEAAASNVSTGNENYRSSQSHTSEIRNSQVGKQYVLLFIILLQKELTSLLLIIKPCISILVGFVSVYHAYPNTQFFNSIFFLDLI